MYPFFSGAKFYYTYVCIYIYYIYNTYVYTYVYIYIYIHEYICYIPDIYPKSTNLPAAVFRSSLCQLLDELEHGQYQLPNESAQISAQCDHVRPVMPAPLGNDTGPKLHTDFDWRHPYAVARICTGTAAFSGGLRQKVPGSSPLWTR